MKKMANEMLQCRKVNGDIQSKWGFDEQDLVELVRAWQHQNKATFRRWGAGNIGKTSVIEYQRHGLLTPPEAGAKGYGELQRLQLVATCVLLDKGLSLNRIRTFLNGKSVPELREFEGRAIEALKAVSTEAIFSCRPAEEMWRVIPLTDDFLLITRSGRSIGTERRRLLAHILKGREVIVPRQPKLHRPRGGGATTLTS